MKPKTKIQKRIVELSKTLKPITPTQRGWAYENCLEKKGKVYKKELLCMQCGHRWDKNISDLLIAIDGCDCPNCNSHLKMDGSNNRVFKQIEYFCIITTCKEFQVLRNFWVEVKHKTTTVAKYECHEVVQRWTNSKGKTYTMSKSRKPMQMYYDLWIFDSELEIRPREHIA